MNPEALAATPPANFFDPYYFPVHLAFAFVLGACFGSFFNVCIYRIPRRVPLAFPGSHCYQCGRPIRWYDNIPLISYWTLGGRCRRCRARFSVRYFLIELLTALMFAAVFARFCNPAAGYSPAVLPGLIFVSLLLIASFTDIDHWIIPDRISLGGAAAGLALALVWPIGLAEHNPLSAPLGGLDLPRALLPAANSLTGAALGFGILWLIGAVGAILFRREAMGQGDMKLFAMFGAFAGPLNCLFILMIASLIGSAFGGATILGRRWGRAPAPHPAVAGLQPDAERIEAMTAQYELPPGERLALTRALTQPGSVGRARHHLPFGPSLALAAAIVYLAWEPMHHWFFTQVLLMP